MSIKKIINKLKAKRRALALSLLSAIVLFLFCYFIDNLPYSFVGKATVGQYIEQIKAILKNKEDKLPEDLWLINVAYDRDLVDITDEFGFPKGNIDITDRKKLYRLLSKLKTTEYNYIILDVAFPDFYNTPQDSSLFALIGSMDNLVVARGGKDASVVDEAINSKARYSEYSTHIAEANFVKYDFFRNGSPSLPNQVYFDLYGDEIKKFGPFYFFHGKLANKSIILQYPVKIWNKYLLDNKKNRSEILFYNLGSDILDCDYDIEGFAKGKLILIGDFTENDLHDTYFGKISGPAINLNAFYALKNDNLSLPYWYVFFLLILYSIVTFYIIERKTILKHDLFINKIKSKTIRYFLSSLGITSLFTIIAAILYLFFSIECNIIIPSLYFSLILAYIKYKDFKTTEL